MRKANHYTRGPWRWIGNTLASGERGTHLFKVEEAPGLGASAEAIRGMIAEAPAMLAALRRIHTVCDGMGWIRRPGDALAEIEALLARIDGKA